jgi:hypothetical protein
MVEQWYPVGAGGKSFPTEQPTEVKKLKVSKPCQKPG